MAKKENYAIIDFFKLFLAFCIVGLHTGFLLNQSYGYYVHTIIFSIGVPFFFICSGYFLACKTTKLNRKSIIKKYIKDLIFIYFVLGSINILMNLLIAKDFSASLLWQNIWQMFTGSSSSVMRYVWSLIISSIILLHLDDNKYLKKALLIFLILFFIGLLFNNYNFLLLNDDFQFFYNFLINNFINNQNWLFCGFLFFGLGYYFNKNNKVIQDYSKNKILIYIILLVGLVITIVEVLIIKKHLDVVVNYEYFIGHLLLIPSLFIILLNSKLNKFIKFDTRVIRKLSAYIYFFHLNIMNLFTKFTTYNYTNIGLYSITCLTTLFVAIFLYYFIKKTNKNQNKLICLFLYSFVGIIIIFATLKLFNKVFWADEACSLKMNVHSFKNIILLNTNDVHPPLYYLMFKLFANILSFSKINEIILGKIFSFIPLIILIIFGLTKVRKNFGYLTAALFVFFITCMPNMIQYYFEIRMYSWALCFVTISFLYMYDILQKNDNKSWILFVIFCILSSYTHLYSCLAICLMFMFLLIYFIKKKDKNYLKKWFIYGFITFILYIPWLIPLFKKITEMNSTGFWIPPITFTNCLEYIRYIFFAEINNRLSKNVFGILMILILLVLLIKNYKNKNEIEKYYIYVGFLILFFTVGIGVFVSIVKTPVFISRYMHSSLGCMWLIYAICLSKYLDKHKYNVFILFIPLFVACANFSGFVITENRLESNEIEFSKMQQSILSGKSIVITNFNHIQDINAYYHPNKDIYLYGEAANKMIKDLFGNLVDNININDIKNLVKNNSDVYFLLQDNTINLSNVLNKTNICYENLGSYNLDWYYVSLNKLKKCEKN